tara:strand:- start:1002 stop:4100 length:3099 start_codon:yes stop_codon:yes gene_type:complete
MSGNDGYVKQIILEANRLQSTEYLGGNETQTAMWNNEVGAGGIKVNIGDEIEVHSAFVSAVGNGAESIELSGESNNDLKKTIKYSVLSKYNSSQNFSERLVGENIYPYQAEYVQILEKEEEIIQKDNEVDMVISFYKTNNGENHIMLPRRWDSAYSAQNVVVDKSGSRVWAASNIESLPNGRFWLSTTTNDHGSCVNIRYESRVNEDWFVYNPTYEAGGVATMPDFVRPTLDNNRYKIFYRKDTFYNTSFSASCLNPITKEIFNASYLSPYEEKQGDTYPYSMVDPIAIPHFKPFTQKITLSAPKGYNSPDDVSGNITQQLNNLEPEININTSLQLSAGTSGSAIEQTLSIIRDSATFKSFYCGGQFQWQRSSYGDHISDGKADWNGSASMDWYNNHQFIGIKRPEIYEKGQQLAGTDTNGKVFYNGSFSFNGVPIPFPYGKADAVIGIPEFCTGFLWNASNLDSMNELFKAQSLYPELFNYPLLRNNKIVNGSKAQINVNNARFLHINASHYGNASSPENISLGSDLYSASGSFFGLANYDRTSMPLWFGYNSDRVDINEGGEDGQAEFNILRYGFAFAKDFGDGNGSYICVNTDSSQYGFGLQNRLFRTTENDDPDAATNCSLEAGTRIGFDNHALGYGNKCMAMYVGLRDTYGTGGKNNIDAELYRPALQDNSGVEHLVYPYFTSIYLGANNPLFNFDTIQNRFYFSQLHTPEYIGNYWKNGIDADFQLTSNPDEQVYKINKILNAFNFCPDCTPYKENLAITTATENASSGISAAFMDTIFKQKNQNITPYAIYDSQCGISLEETSIEDKGFRTSLLGILGFTKEQFNLNLSSSGVVNSQTRTLNNKPIRAVSLTTNADIVASDPTKYGANPYGALSMGLMPPTPFIQEFGENVVAYAPIVQACDSSRVVATNLPRKMIKPFYTIRSNIIGEGGYYGAHQSANPSPVVSIVNKMGTGGGDYYFQENSNIKFTATKPYTIQNIKTSVHDPDGKLSNDITDDSAVIYRINKNINANMNLIEDLMQQSKKK